MKIFYKLTFLIYIFNYLLISNLNAVIINVPSDSLTIQSGINGSNNGDTVIVQPGTYIENLNFNGKKITVASKYLQTQDTSYISHTIINGNHNDAVVVFDSGENNSSVLCGFTITNGYSECGGGVVCYYSNPTLKYLSITENTATQKGGGIYIDNSSPILTNVTVKGNINIWGNGGGIYCTYSYPLLSNVTIVSNYTTASNSDGGGIMSTSWSLPVFDSENLCNIYLNKSGDKGNDIYITSNVTVNLDTFTVLNPDDYFAYPIDNLTLNIEHGKIEQSNQDLYVAPDGSNNNSGLNPDDPLQSLSYAFLKIIPDSISERTIHLENGTYSSSMTNEKFPINYRSNISIKGVNKRTCIIDGEKENNIFNCYSDSCFTVQNITIMNGVSDYGGGIFCIYSDFTLSDVIITENHAHDGGGLYIYESSLVFKNVTIKYNSSSDYGGGIYFGYQTSPVFDNVDKCDIFLNNSRVGNDLYVYNCSTINVVLDTFSVLHPDDYFASPIDDFIFKISNSKIAQVNQDLYVATDGSDNNSGFNSENPLLTISNAIARITADSLNPRIIFLKNGIYSNSQTGERFPLQWKSYVSLSGEDKNATILDAEKLGGIIFLDHDTCVSLNNITVQNGCTIQGGGIYCKYSILNIYDMIIYNNLAEGSSGWNPNGGGILSYRSKVNLDNVEIKNNNTSGEGGGISCGESELILVNVTLNKNIGSIGGGICILSSNTTIKNVIVNENIASLDGGGMYLFNSDPEIMNTLIVKNTASRSGGAICSRSGSSPLLTNVTIADVLVRY